MTLEEATAIINKHRVSSIDNETPVAQAGNLYSLSWYLSWDRYETEARLDGWFSADELEAIAVYMSAHIKKPGES